MLTLEVKDSTGVVFAVLDDKSLVTVDVAQLRAVASLLNEALTTVTEVLVAHGG